VGKQPNFCRSTFPETLRSNLADMGAIPRASAVGHDFGVGAQADSGQVEHGDRLA